MLSKKLLESVIRFPRHGTTSLVYVLYPRVMYKKDGYPYESYHNVVFLRLLQGDLIFILW